MMGWRSVLIVPASDAARIAKAHTRGADLLVLDLEDGVAPDAKASARASLAAHVAALVGNGQSVGVRINTGWRDVVADLDAAILPGVRALVVPKAEDEARLSILAEMVGEWEAARGLPVGDIGLIALVETPLALHRLEAIAAARRVVGLALGSEDYCLGLGVAPTPESLSLPCQLISAAGAARGLMRFGLPISLASFGDLAAYGEAVRAARAMGLTGALCIHPSQVTLANEGFAPSAADLAEAALISQRWDARGDAAVISVGGRMIDQPVAMRLKALLGRAG
jgi:citrate lyase subunit beta / citryl-CoA lyase